MRRVEELLRIGVGARAGVGHDDLGDASAELEQPVGDEERLLAVVVEEEDEDRLKERDEAEPFVDEVEEVRPEQLTARWHKGGDDDLHHLEPKDGRYTCGHGREQRTPRTFSTR